MTDLTGPAPDAATLTRAFIDLLHLEKIDTDLFRGPAKIGGAGRMYGGQVVAQALMAVQQSIDDDKIAHSAHAYFLRPGDEDVPIVFRIERDFEGRSIANRRVIATQRGLAIFNMTASFQRAEVGMAHCRPMPEIPQPEDLPEAHTLLAPFGDALPKMAWHFLLNRSAFEVRPIGQPPFLHRGSSEARDGLWFRLRAPVPADPCLHKAILGYLSDYSLLSTSAMPHNINMSDHPLRTASLDHAIWFHEHAPLDDWMLYSTESPWADHGRGLSMGTIFTRDGRMIATVAQEGLVRVRPPPG
jgi:acyl-CoA thioesterase-2